MFGFPTKVPGSKRPSSGDFSDLRSDARSARCPLSLPHGLGVTGRMLFWVPDQNNALRFSGFQPEARLRATLGQDAPHGRGVSDPSPCAPPRQAGKPGPIGHRVVGFCGTARGEWAGPVWAKKQVGAGSDMSVVSTLLEVGRIPGEFIRGVEPPLMCAFYLAFCTSKKQAVRPDGTGHSVPPAAHLSKR